MREAGPKVFAHALPGGDVSLARDVGCCAFVAVLVLLPFGRSSEAGVLLLLVLGAWLAARRAPLGRTGSTRLLLVLFACWWVPQLASAIDAVAPAKTWSAVLVAARLLPIAVVSAWALSDDEWRHRVALVIATIVAIWTLDALVQAFAGVGLRGRMHSDRVSGIFGDSNLKLGPILAILTPWALHVALERWGRLAAVAVWILTAVVVLLAGTRAGWIVFALVSFAFAWRLVSRLRNLAWVASAFLLALLAFGTVAMQFSPLFAERIHRTLRAAHGDDASLDYALAGRLPIWRNAVAMALAYPVNGVGIRGFRFAYPEFAPAGDPWLDAKRTQGASHPHQLVLETAAETGVIGLVGLGCLMLFAVRAWLAATAAAKRAAWPAGVALLAMWWPLNTNFASYSSFWGLLLWWLAAYFAAAIVGFPARTTRPGSSIDDGCT